jgi:spore coat polysaccharide biosynthesis protein SpsF
MEQGIDSLKTLVIIQARMGPTRLPGKSLLPILNRPVLGRLLDRLALMKQRVRIVVATSREKGDLPIVDFCRREGVDFFTGSEEDVLERYTFAARHFGGDIIVRLTGDCPLIDPEVVDRAIERFVDLYPECDYLSNTLKRTYPRGLDVEVFKRRALERAFEEAFLTGEREHVTPYIWRHPELFSLASLEAEEDLSGYRLTLDTAEDLDLITKIIEGLSKKSDLPAIVSLLKLHPDWVKINQHIEQKNAF